MISSIRNLPFINRDAKQLVVHPTLRGELTLSPTLYPLCVPCANLACPAFLYFNLTQWTQGSCKGRYSTSTFPYPALPRANGNSPLQLPHLSQFNPTQLPSDHLNTAYDLLLLLWGWYFCSFDVL